MTTPDPHPNDDPNARNAMTPREIVKALDRYIVGQHSAKRAVAIALRDRWRRQQVPASMRDEISPKNIILIGPTGVGKTEVARRLARLARAPFVKVEASKFTEVGYVGRDVESMIRDLVDVAIGIARAEAEDSVRERAQEAALARALDLLPSDVKFANLRPAPAPASSGPPAGYTAGPGGVATRRLDKPRTDDLLERLKAGEFDAVEVEVDVPSGANPLMQIFSQRGGFEEMDMSGLLDGAFPKNTARKKLPLKDAMPLLVAQESDAMIDMDHVVQRALVRAQEDGIVFLDEIDKIAGNANPNGPDVSRGGVQRDLLPIIEGSQVRTKHGIVKTDHILFIAAGAFHVAKPSDLLPELQGRFPIRVELDSLNEDDFARILTEPRNSLVEQYIAMLATEQLDLRFTDDAIAELASIAAHVNRTLEDIGARRLHTVMERLLDDLSFKAPELLDKRVTIDRAYVRDALKDIAEDTDLSRYIL